MITEKYRGAHFATFPEILAERCIKAGAGGGTDGDNGGGIGIPGFSAALAVVSVQVVSQRSHNLDEGDEELAEFVWRPDSSGFLSC